MVLRYRSLLAAASSPRTRTPPPSGSSGREWPSAGKGGNRLVSLEDVDGDGRTDLVATFEDVAGTREGGKVEAELVGEARDGAPLRGSDRICLAP